VTVVTAGWDPVAVVAAAHTVGIVALAAVAVGIVADSGTVDVDVPIVAAVT